MPTLLQWLASPIAQAVILRTVQFLTLLTT